jgi:hypothetical protein
MGNNCHKSPELLIEKGEKYFHFLLASECVRRASACLCAEAPGRNVPRPDLSGWAGSFTSPERLLSASFWGRGFTQTGVTLHRCGLLHRPMKFLILNKDSNRGNKCSGMLRKMVGARGFEPPTPDTPCQCATRLRYAPINHEFNIFNFLRKVQSRLFI